MPLSYNMNGTWKTVRYAYAKVSGSWKSVGQIWVKRSGTWYRIWTYSWTTGSWGSCSADCGGGTQTRSVTCTRNDGYTFDDSYCTSFGAGTKPSTSQSCNTDECVVEECPAYSKGTNYWYATYHESNPDDDSGGANNSGRVSIYYDASIVYSASMLDSLSVTEVTTGGYIYSRGSLRDSEDDEYSSGAANRYRWYSYCRTPL